MVMSHPKMSHRFTFVSIYIICNAQRDTVHCDINTDLYQLSRLLKNLSFERIRQRLGLKNQT